MPTWNKAVSAAMAGVFAFNAIGMPAQAITKDELNSLSYSQVKGTGLANRCPEVVGEQSISLANGAKYKITELCIEPKTFQVSAVFGLILKYLVLITCKTIFSIVG
jgi:photosystem II oxygen-evolving enhancer protein 1